MRALVTGHLGFVGTHLCRCLADRGHEVTGIDLKQGQDVRTCLLPQRVDRVFHLAAQTDAQSRDAKHDASVNVLGAVRFFSEYGDRLVYASSSMVRYPVTPYAISKRAAEDYARFFGCAVVRLCNLFGEGGHSAVDKFREDDVLTVRGTGQQLRTYAPVSEAVDALVNAEAGSLYVLAGMDCRVIDLVKLYDKPVRWVPASPMDVLDGRQVPDGQ